MTSQASYAILLTWSIKAIQGDEQMKTETFKGTVESAYGKTLPSPVSFSGQFEAVEKTEEIPQSEQLGPADIIQVVNAKRKAAARAKATTEALQAAGIEKPDTSSPEYVTESIIKGLMKLHGLSEDEARRVITGIGAAR